MMGGRMLAVFSRIRFSGGTDIELADVICRLYCSKCISVFSIAAYNIFLYLISVACAPA